MTQHTHQTAPTQFAEANGIRFAYRRFGKPNGVPLDQVLVHRGCDVKEADGVVTEIRKPELYARKPALRLCPGKDRPLPLHLSELCEALGTPTPPWRRITWSS